MVMEKQKPLGPLGMSAIMFVVVVGLVATIWIARDIRGWARSTNGISRDLTLQCH